MPVGAEAQIPLSDAITMGTDGERPSPYCARTFTVSETGKQGCATRQSVHAYPQVTPLWLTLGIRLPSRDLIADSIEAVCSTHPLYPRSCVLAHPALHTPTIQVTLVRRSERALGTSGEPAHASPSFFFFFRPSTMMVTYRCPAVTRICLAVRWRRRGTTARRSSCMAGRYRPASGVSIVQRWDTRKVTPSIYRTPSNHMVNCGAVAFLSIA
jgi:hypothetical protein